MGARRWFVVDGLDGSYGDDVAKVNDLASKHYSLQRLLEVLNSSIVGYADEDDFLWLGRSPGGATFVHPPLHVHHFPNNSMVNTGPGPNVVVEEHTDTNGKGEMWV